VIKRILIRFALKILRAEVVDRIDSPTYTPVLAIGFANLERAAELVTDGDPNDKAQLNALWQSQKKPILLGALDTTRAIIVEEVNDPRTESYIVTLVDEIREEVEAGNILRKAA
jgi:hypothetical protein